MTAMLLPPWSFSMIEMFENCPRKAFHKYILKEKEPETEAMRQGNLLDKAIENRIVKGTPLPPEFVQYDPMAASIAAIAQSDCAVRTQHKMGITRDFKPCDFWDKNVWGRGALDVSIIKRKSIERPGEPMTAVITDWKTGKNNENKPYSNKGLQLKIFTLLLFKWFPGLDEVTAFNIWLKSNEFGKVYKWTRADEVTLWREVLPRVIAIEKAYAQQRWPLVPGPLCGYCPVKACEFNKS